MLHITKRAASEADSKAILEASYQVQSPFGVPILLVDPDRYARKSFMGIPLPSFSIKRPIHTELKNVLAQCAAPAVAPSNAIKLIDDRGYFNYTPEILERKIISILKECEIDPSEAVAFALPNESPPRIRDHGSQRERCRKPNREECFGRKQEQDARLSRR
jgi:hypothetical protein